MTVGNITTCGSNQCKTTRARQRVAWEIDWTKRRTQPRDNSPKHSLRVSVWARNPISKTSSAREWHWTDVSTLKNAGILWQLSGKRSRTHERKPSLTKQGYVRLHRNGMTADDVAFADINHLFSKDGYCLEHRLKACRIYGGLPSHTVVRHWNGVKSDNSDDNLLLGTNTENIADHNRARLLAMYWHSRFRLLARKYEALKKRTGGQLLLDVGDAA